MKNNKKGSIVNIASNLWCCCLVVTFSIYENTDGMTSSLLHILQLREVLLILQGIYHHTLENITLELIVFHLAEL